MEDTTKVEPKLENQAQKCESEEKSCCGGGSSILRGCPPCMLLWVGVALYLLINFTVAQFQ